MIKKPLDLAAISAGIRAAVSVFSVIFMLAGLFVILFCGVPILKPAIESWKWPSVEGTVLKSFVLGTGGGSSMPSVEFQYDVSGKTYQSESIWMGHAVGLPGRERSEAVVRRYPVGERVTVFYDPANNERAVLERGVHGTTLFFFYFGGAFFAGGLIMWLLRPALIRIFSIPSSGPAACH